MPILSQRILPCVRLWLTITSLGLSLSLSLACFPVQTLNLRGGHCVNPTDTDCHSDERDSRPIRIKVYPLSRCPELSSLKWADLTAEEGKDKELLGPLWLANPEELILERLEEQVLRPQLPRHTRCYLLVTVGRREGNSSMLSLRPGICSRTQHLLVDRVDLYVEDAALQKNQKK